METPSLPFLPQQQLHTGAEDGLLLSSEERMLVPRLPRAQNASRRSSRKAANSLVPADRNSILAHKEQNEEGELQTLKDLQIRNRTQFVNLLMRVKSDSTKYNSAVVLAEVILKQAMVATQDQPSPNALRTAVACYALDRVTAQVGTAYSHAFAVIRKELFSAIFTEDKQHALATPLEVIPYRCTLGAEAAASHKYIGNTLQFESARVYKLQLEQSKQLFKTVAGSLAKCQMVVGRAVENCLRPYVRLFFKIWRNWVKGARQSKWMRKRRTLRIEADLAAHTKGSAFLRWRLNILASKFVKAEEHKSSLMYQLGNANNQFTLLCFKAERYLVTIDDLREQLTSSTTYLTQEKQKNYDASALLNVEHNNKMKEVANTVSDLAAMSQQWMALCRSMLHTKILKDIPDERSDALTHETQNINKTSGEKEKEEKGVASDMQEYITRPAEAVLLKWANELVSACDLIESRKAIGNFGSDWADGEYFIVILNRISPTTCHLSGLQETSLARKYEYILESSKALGINFIPRAQDMAEGVTDMNFLFLYELFRIYATRSRATKEHIGMQQDVFGNDEFLKSDVPEDEALDLDVLPAFIKSSEVNLEQYVSELKEHEAREGCWQKVLDMMEAQAYEMREARINNKPVTIVDGKELQAYLRIPKSKLKDIHANYTVSKQQAVAPAATPLSFDVMMDNTLDIIKQNFQEIRRVFRHYCSLTTESPSADTMTQASFWKFCTDSKCMDKELTKSVVSEIFKKVNSVPQMPTSDEADENPDTELVPAEFVESVIRLSDKKMPSEPTLDARVRAFIYKYVKLSTTRAELSKFRSSIYDRNMQKVLQRHGVELQRVFKYYAGFDKKSSKNRTINFIEFMKLLQDCNLLVFPLDEQAAHNIFLAMQDTTPIDDNDSQEEYLYHEFTEALVACTVYRYPCPYIPLDNRVEHFVTSNILTHLRPRLKHHGIRIDPDLKVVPLVSIP